MSDMQRACLISLLLHVFVFSLGSIWLVKHPPSIPVQSFHPVEIWLESTPVLSQTNLSSGLAAISSTDSTIESEGMKRSTIQPIKAANSFQTENHKHAPRADGAGLIAGSNDRIAGSAFAPGWEQPRIIERTEPDYPEEARRNKEQGVVLLRLVVSEAGRVEDAVVEKSSGHVLLDQAALRAVKNWRFAPARKAEGSVPVRSATRIPFRFSLD